MIVEFITRFIAIMKQDGMITVVNILLISNEKSCLYCRLNDWEGRSYLDDIRQNDEMYSTRQSPHPLQQRIWALTLGQPRPEELPLGATTRAPPKDKAALFAQINRSIFCYSSL